MNNDDDYPDYSEYKLSNYRQQKYRYRKEERDDYPVTVYARMPDEIDGEPTCVKEDVYSPEWYHGSDRPRYGKRKQSGKRSKGRGRRAALIVCAILLCFCSTLLIADTVSGGYVLDEISAMFTAGDGKYYAIEMASYSDADSARLYARQVRSRGGAGYVIVNSMYRVIADVYADKEDAEIVLAKMNTSESTSKIVELKIYDVEYKYFPDSVRNITRTALKNIPALSDGLTVIGQNLMKEKIDHATAVSELKNLANRAEGALLDYESACDNKVDDSNVMRVRVQLKAISAGLQNLSNTSMERPNLICDIRYTNVMIINTYSNLTAVLSKKS